MNDFEILSIGPSWLVSTIADSFKKTVVNVEVDHFADSETFLKLSGDTVKIINNKNIFIVFQFSFDEKKLINDQLFGLLLLVNLLKKIGAKKIIAILPYLPYARSNKSDYGDFIGDIDIVCKFLKLAGLEKIICCDLHAPAIKDVVGFQINEIELIDFWIEHIKNCNHDHKLCFVSPDKGAMEKNRKAAVGLDADFAFIEKIRLKTDHAVTFNLHGDIKNKTVIILDDIIDTAKTAVSACDLILKNGAKKVIGCFTHAVLSKDAKFRIENSNFDKVFVTDTVLFDSKDLGGKFSVVNIGDFVCQKISTLKI